MSVGGISGAGGAGGVNESQGGDNPLIHDLQNVDTELMLLAQQHPQKDFTKLKEALRVFAGACSNPNNTKFMNPTVQKCLQTLEAQNIIGTTGTGIYALNERQDLWAAGPDGAVRSPPGSWNDKSALDLMTAFNKDGLIYPPN